MRHWYVREDDDTWQLFLDPDYGNSFILHPQIIKAPKKNTGYAEYWPTPEQTKFILDALNEAERGRHE